jgi:hypothetical protein
MDFKTTATTRAFVSGRAVSEAEVAELIAALDPEKLAAMSARYAKAEAE